MPSASETLSTITHKFRAIGIDTDTKFTDLSAKEAVAHEFIVAKTLARLATKRLETAEREAEKAGVIGDSDKLVKGQEVTIWKPKKAPPGLIITARTSNDCQPVLDKTLLEQELIKRYSQKVAQAIIEKSLKPVAPRVTISVVFFT